MKADLILLNCNIINGDGHHETARAIAIKGGKIAAVGANDEMARLRGRFTRIAELRGKTVLPGFIDSHNHQLHTGLNLPKVQLGGARSIADVLKTIEERAISTAEGGWIEVSGAWHESFLKENRLPTRAELDAVSPRNPVFLPRGWHLVMVNSLALKAAGINKNTPNPQGGRIERDISTGEPTGLLFEPSAFAPILKLLPQPTLKDQAAAIKAVQARYHGRGLTSTIDPGLSLDELMAYREVWLRGELTIRTTAMLMIDTGKETEQIESFIESLGEYQAQGDEVLRIEALKLITDGGGQTSLLREPYAHDPTYYGVQVVDEDKLKRIALAALKKGWRLGIHASGGKAIDFVLSGLREVDKQIPIRGKRFMLIHAKFPTEENLRTIKELGIVVTVQQPLSYQLGGTYIKFYGLERAHRSSPHRFFLDNGVPIGAGSDSYIAPYDPLLAIWSLVTRKTARAGVLGADQRVSRSEAIAMYTKNNSFLTFEEDQKGTIAPGKLADLVVLSDDILRCAEDDIKDLLVEATMVGGKLVHGVLD